MSRKEQTIRFFQGLVYRYRDDEVPALAAQLTYYLILAFFPLLLFIVAVLGFVHLSSDSLINQLIVLLPSETGGTVKEILAEVRSNRSGSLLSIGIIGTIWSASNGINAIIKGLNKAYDQEEDRPFWKVRGISLLATLVMAVMIVLAMSLLIFGRQIGGYVFRLLRLSSSFEFVWGIVNYAVPIAAMIAVFTFIYWLTPNRRLKFREVLPGAVFSTVGWIATSLLFQLYVNNFSNYTKTYGSLGGVIVLLIWLYLSSTIIILGGEINAALAFSRDGVERQLGKEYGAPMPWFKRLLKAAQKGKEDATLTKPQSMSSGKGARSSGGRSLGGSKFS